MTTEHITDGAKPVERPRPNQINDTTADAASEATVDVEQPATVVENKVEDDVPPNGGYGWVCVACNAAINAHTWGINSTYGVFLAYYLSNDFFPNTSPLAYAFIGGLSISQAVMVGPLANFIIARYGTKVCLHLGIFLETLGLLGASFSTQKYQIILAQGFCFGWGMGFLFSGSVSIIPQWFTTRRSVANSIAAAGSGLGAMIYSLAAGKAIYTIGLPWTFRIIAICTFAVNLTAANLLRDRNKQTGAHYKPFDLDILKRPEFLLLQGWSYFSMFGYTILVFSVPAYARTIGLTSAQGSILNATLNLGQMIGRPLIGLSSDRYGRINLAALYTLLCGLTIFAFWIPAEVAPSSYGLLIFFTIIGGALAGTFWTTIAPVGAEVVGVAHLPSALSLTWVLMVPPTTCAEAIALELRDQGAMKWVYLPPQIFCAFMYVGGAMCLWVLRGWKIGQLEVLERRLKEKKSGAGGVVALVNAKEDGSVEKLESSSSGIEKIEVPLEPALQRLGTREDVLQESWAWRPLLRRMCKVQKV